MYVHVHVVVCTDFIRQVGRVLRHDGKVHVVDDASQLQTARHDAVIAVHAVPAKAHKRQIITQQTQLNYTGNTSTNKSN